jgi:hypothetical protein
VAVSRPIQTHVFWPLAVPSTVATTGAPPLSPLAAEEPTSGLLEAEQSATAHCPVISAERKGPRKLERFRPEVVDLGPTWAPKPDEAKPKRPGRCPQTGTKRFRAISSRLDPNRPPNRTKPNRKCPGWCPQADTNRLRSISDRFRTVPTTIQNLSTAR